MSQPQRDRIDAIARHLNGARSLVLAVSGGADSTAMTLALDRVGRWSLTIAHIHHNLHQYADSHANHVANLGARLGLPVVIRHVDVPAQLPPGANVEAFARDLRYRALESVRQELGADLICTAHTANDQAETILMRAERGVGLRGLVGIPPRREHIVRPLLTWTRDDTESYCRARGVDVVEDPTNTDLSRTRNRVRHTLLPQLERLVPGMRDRLAHLATTAGTARRIADAVIADDLSRLREERPGTWVLPIPQADDDSLSDCLAAAVRRIAPGADWRRRHYEAAIAIARRRDGSGKSLDLPALTLRREYDSWVFITGHEPTPQLDELKLAPGILDLGGWTFDIQRGSIGKVDRWRAPISARGPVVLRRARPGDRVRRNGRASKRLSDVFADANLPRRHRPWAWVVADDSSVLWVPGLTRPEPPDGSEQLTVTANVDKHLPESEFFLTADV